MERPILSTPLRAFDDLVRDGKIRYPAVSNWAAFQIARAVGISYREGLARFELMQPMYSLAKRQAESELLPLAEVENIGVISYSPLGGGLLTGKYNGLSKPEAGRLIDRDMYAKRYSLEHYYETAGRFCAHAEEKNIKPATLAVAWVMAHPAITAPIIGAPEYRTVEGFARCGER